MGIQASSVALMPDSELLGLGPKSESVSESSAWSNDPPLLFGLWCDPEEIDGRRSESDSHRDRASDRAPYNF